MKQTAVEWLISKLASKIDDEYWSNQQDITELVHQAIQMEKEQLCFFYVKGAEAELNNPYITNIEFYNKQFKNK